MSLFEKIGEDLKAAMKNKEQERISALRMVRTELLKKQKESADVKMTDDLVVGVLQSLAKRYEESIEQFTTGGRDDLVQQEAAQLKIIQSYLPEKMSRDEIKSVVDAIIRESGALSKRDFGKVMGQAMRKLKESPKLVDGSEVKEVVTSVLENLEKGE